MSSTLDLSLGDIISQRKQDRRGGNDRRQRRQGGGGGGGGSHPLDRTSDDRSSGPIRNRRSNDNRRSTPYARSEAAAPSFAAPAAAAAPSLIGDTIRCSNLNPTITEDEIRFIFEKIGLIRNITIHYNQHGECVGTAEVQFDVAAAAHNAAQTLDQAEVDGRIMYVQIVGQVVPPSLQPRQPVVQPRRDNAPRDRRDDRDRRDYDRRGNDRRGNDRRPRDNDRRGGNQRGGNNANPRRGGNNNNNNNKRDDKGNVSMEDLDKEMESYHSSKTGAETAPAATDNQTPAAAATENAAQ